MGNAMLIETNNLVKYFGKRKVIDNLSLSVAEGDIYGFLGPNGSGKTTTIRMLLGLVHPNSGTIKLSGYDIKTDFDKGIAQIGAIVENPSFYTYLSGYENLQLMANLHPGLPKGRIDEVLDTVRLKERANDKVRTYSLGMRQRLGIAMALLNSPKLVILDEPTNGLDPQGMKEVKDLILGLAKEMGISFFISTTNRRKSSAACRRSLSNPAHRHPPPKQETNKKQIPRSFNLSHPYHFV
jgi:ABC-2 type transport system ATP-binding protein